MRLRQRLLLSLIAVLFFGQALPAAAKNPFIGVRGGYYTKVEEPFVGAELLARIAHRVYFNPNVEYVFTEGSTYLSFNGDFHYDLPTHRDIYVWIGGGLGVVRIDPDGPREATTDAAANILAGFGFRGEVIPYFQAKIVAKDDTEFVLAFGLRF